MLAKLSVRRKCAIIFNLINPYRMLKVAFGSATGHKDQCKSLMKLLPT